MSSNSGSPANCPHSFAGPLSIWPSKLVISVTRLGVLNRLRWIQLQAIINTTFPPAQNDLAALLDEGIHQKNQEKICGKRRYVRRAQSPSPFSWLAAPTLRL